MFRTTWFQLVATTSMHTRVSRLETATPRSNSVRDSRQSAYTLFAYGVRLAAGVMRTTFARLKFKPREQLLVRRGHDTGESC